MEPQTGHILRRACASLRRRASRRGLRTRPEFRSVNSVAGTEPVRPELSGLRLRTPGLPRRATQVLITLHYRWRPSGEYERRQSEMGTMNDDLRRTRATARRRRSRPVIPPPILLFPEKTDVAPTRLQPCIDPDPRFSRLRDLPHDLRDLEERERPHAPSMLQPRLPEPAHEYLTVYRHLLPREYRYFLRHSPYPRLVLAITMGVAAILGGLWVSRIQQAEASAAGSYRVARYASHVELAAAAAYGVDPHLLRPLYRRTRYLDSLPAPADPILGRARLQFYRTQEVHYRSLLLMVRRLEQHALMYWRRQEQGAYSALIRAMVMGTRQSLSLHIPVVPACTTPRCFRAAARQWARLRDSRIVIGG